jgi:prolyl 4-hydroxylase
MMVRYNRLIRIWLSIGLVLAIFATAMIFQFNGSAFTSHIGSDHPSAGIEAEKMIRGAETKKSVVTTVGVDLGEPQILGKMAAKVIQRVEKARKYFQETVMVEPRYEIVRTLCRNQNKECALWAAQGQCHKTSRYMKTQCAPVCFSCENTHMETRCPLDPNAVNAWLPGDLNLMFERITTDPSFEQYTPKVLSRPSFVGKDTNETADYQLGPWVLLFENLVSNEESEYIIQVGHDIGYKKSLTGGTLDKAGKAGVEETTRRTSANAWCKRELCDTDPLITGVHNRIEGLTYIPNNNSESLQLLRYEEGQFYKTHNDYIPHERGRIQGVRILTFFLYLNDVEEGGGTNFPELNLTVQPKRGRAVIWPSVLDAYPHQADPRTNHQALPVIRGLKYGANAWLHQRDIQTPELIGCLDQ